MKHKIKLKNSICCMRFADQLNEKLKRVLRDEEHKGRLNNDGIECSLSVLWAARTAFTDCDVPNDGKKCRNGNQIKCNHIKMHSDYGCCLLGTCTRYYTRMKVRVFRFVHRTIKNRLPKNWRQRLDRTEY